MHTPNPEIKGQRLAKGLYYDIGLQLMKLLNILLIVAAFAGCWLLYYVNRVIMRPSPLRSAGVILLFTFLYSFFERVYDAFQICFSASCWASSWRMRLCLSRSG